MKKKEKEERKCSFLTQKIAFCHVYEWGDKYLKSNRKEQKDDNRLEERKEALIF